MPKNLRFFWLFIMRTDRKEMTVFIFFFCKNNVSRKVRSDREDSSRRMRKIINMVRIEAYLRSTNLFSTAQSQLRASKKDERNVCSFRAHSMSFNYSHISLEEYLYSPPPPPLPLRLPQSFSSRRSLLPPVHFTRTKQTATSIAHHSSAPRLSHFSTNPITQLSSPGRPSSDVNILLNSRPLTVTSLIIGFIFGAFRQLSRNRNTRKQHATTTIAETRNITR